MNSTTPKLSLNDFTKTMENIRLYLRKELGLSRKIYDKDIANALSMSQQNFATSKRRGSIPYENILLFCKRNNISIDTTFFGETECIPLSLCS